MNKNIHYILFLFGVWGLLALIPNNLQAQSVQVSGKVSDAKGDPVVGATVFIVGTGIGTYTDIEGNFEIGARLGAGSYILRAALLNYRNTDYALQVGSDGLRETSIELTLSDDAMNLDEVVVTGSTLTSSRRQLGNAISTVSADQLARSGSSDALASLQGKVAGAQITQNSGDPAGGISVRLRGVNSIRGNSDPLYIVDGVIVNNATTNVSQIAVSAGEAALGTNRLVDLDPSDIQDVTVISGAAAAAVYGSRAANGVVLITTKRGKSGKPEVVLSTSLNMNQLRKRVHINTYGKQFGAANLFLHTIANTTQAAYPQGIDVAGRRLATNLVDVTRYDYQDQIFQNGLGTDNNLSVSGGNDRSKYFVSLGYMQNEGIIRNTDFRRYNLRTNLDQNISDWMKVSVGLNYSNSFSNELPNGNVFFSPINGMTITGNIFDITEKDANGNFKAVEQGRVNPNTVIETFDITQNVNRGGGNIQFNIFPVKGLRFDWVTGVDAFSQLGKTYIPIFPYSGVNPGNFPNGYAGVATNLAYLFNSDINASYEFNLGKRIKSTTVAGYNYQYSQSDYTVSSGQNLSPAIQTINGAASTTVSSRYSLDRFSVSGYFLQETFGFDNQFFLTLAGRVDGSSKFSEEENNQFYPKVSASWVASDLGFWKNAFGSAWNGLKLRASFGDAGGLTALGTYDRFWQFSPAAYLGKNTIVPGSQYANPAVRPERTRELELGADLSFLNNRLNLGITYYDQQVTDLIVPRVLASSTGARSIINNLGEMENKGIELTLNATAIRSKDFNVDFYGVYSRNRNKITKVVKSPTSNLPIPLPIDNVLGAPAFIIEGQPAGVFFGFYQAKDANGKEIFAQHPDGSFSLLQQEKGTISTYKPGDPIPEGSYVISGTLYTPQRDANGQPTGTPLRGIIGDPNPDFTASFGSNISWKKLRAGFLLDAVYGVDVFNADKRTRQGVGLGEYAEKELRGELPRGWVWAMYPVESWRVDDGSFLKLREVSLGYELGNLGNSLKNLTLTLVGRNLISWDNYNGYDPETNAGGNSDLLRGTDFGNVPIPRTYQATLTAKF